MKKLIVVTLSGGDTSENQALQLQQALDQGYRIVNVITADAVVGVPCEGGRVRISRGTTVHHVILSRSRSWLRFW